MEMRTIAQLRSIEERITQLQAEVKEQLDRLEKMAAKLKTLDKRVTMTSALPEPGGRDAPH